MENTLKRINLHIESPGVYYSPLMDSGEKDMVWHRMEISFQSAPGAILRVSCYASNEKHLSHRGKVRETEEILKDSAMDEVERQAYLSTAHVREYENPKDILLHDVKGRFFWCRFELINTNSADVRLNSISVSYPAQSLIDYLPEIYGERSGFTDRYLSIFQTLYEGLESQIERSSALYNIDSAPYDFLLWIGDWIALEDLLLWPPQKLRELLRYAMDIYRKRGTLAGLSLLLKLYSGEEAYFIETYHAMRYYLGEHGKVLERLYSRDRFSFHVMLTAKLNEKDEQAIRRLIKKNKPAHTRAQLIMLKPYMVLSGYTYLGVNSALSGYALPYLDGQCELNYIILGGSHNAI